MLAIFKRELRNYFMTPIGYIFMGLFLLVAGFFFAYGNLFTKSSYYSGLLGNILFVYIFAIPLLTMRSISEEKHQRTDQLLLTSPIRVIDIIGGKFLAAFTVFLITLFITILYALIVGIYGDIAVWETIGAYIGFMLLGACFIALGIFVSALTENQVTAAFVTFFALLLIWLIDLVEQVVPKDNVAGLIFAFAAAIGLALFLYFNTRNLILTLAIGVAVLAAVLVIFFINRLLYDGLISKVLSWFSLLKRYNSFNMGLLKLDSIVYYLSFAFAFLFLSVRVIEKKRWT
jgi:ABC-2 type transport system permease protein